MRALLTVGLIITGSAAPLCAEDHAAKFTKRSFIEIENSASALNLNHDFTIEVWTKWSDSDRVEVIAGDEVWPGMAPDISVAENRGWTLRKWRVEDQDVIDFTVGIDQGTAGWFTLKEALAKKSANWVHIAVCRRNDSLMLFANGKRLATAGIKGRTLFKSPTPMYLGVRKNAHENRNFYGYIRGFRVSSKARYSSSFSVAKSFDLSTDDDTLVLFNFDRVGDNKVFDDSGHDRHGAFEGVELLTLKK